MKKTILVLSLIALSITKPIYNFKTSFVTQLTPLNFNDQVSKYRQNTHYVSVVHFYKSSGNISLYLDGQSEAFVPEMDKWNNEYKGVFRIGAVDCEEYLNLCEKEGVTQFPTVKIYPSVPIPVVTYNVYPFLFRNN